ncbi:NAD-dependent epimerase/dehydratase family protein [Sphingomonas sp. CGMCC 1.13654]|uniref:NAD-dependent epimerase/dehydratase family protein n=1 Tax=Sphingomonas chungangi TaxID=2683589 RepID=A0A838L870_9SPHN|nr:hopanoid-associated sugar epimerase [Sphingomonas chungangi]MBA2934739.1 NAD-dependent epimerase/dehydratase family protein [Sphingomonas chungangi]MVW58050.1 NAD-dependent epimerase/dehydratase family protein [Sphingomonas chungangi]
MKGTILITGVSGFVGAAVAKAFAADGWQVKGLARASSPTTNLEGFPGEIIRGDMMDPIAMARALEGCDALAHVAADYRLWAPDPEEIVRHNLEGTRVVMEAALAADVKRIVYTSSVATIAPLPDGAAGEDRPLTEQTAIGAYKRSKVAAERLVERMVAERSLPAVIVNPSTPIGPRDVKPTPTGRILVEAATGKIPAFVDTGLNIVHVDDVARGHVLALDKGEPGRRYILGGEDVMLQALLTELAHRVGRKPPTISLPTVPLMPLAAVSEAWGWLRNKEPLFTRDALRMAKYKMFFSSERAKTELGYTYRPWQQAVGDALDWFHGQGMI